MLYFRSFFSSDDCDKIISLKSQRNSSKVSIWSSQEKPIFDADKRSGTVASITNLDIENLALEADLNSLMVRIKKKYKISNEGNQLSFQICEYRKGDHFKVWHTDSDHKYLDDKRTLTMVVLLSKTSAFEGGELFLQQSSPINAELEQGDIIFFPSKQTHRITEITSGERFSLVSWI